MASVTEQLIMRIALIDAVTRPLAGINNQLNRVKETAQSGFANITGGGAAMLAGTLISAGTAAAVAAPLPPWPSGRAASASASRAPSSCSAASSQQG